MYVRIKTIERTSYTFDSDFNNLEDLQEYLSDLSQHNGWIRIGNTLVHVNHIISAQSVNPKDLEKEFEKHPNCIMEVTEYVTNECDSE